MKLFQLPLLRRPLLRHRQGARATKCSCQQPHGTRESDRRRLPARQHPHRLHDGRAKSVPALATRVLPDKGSTLSCRRARAAPERPAPTPSGTATQHRRRWHRPWRWPGDQPALRLRRRTQAYAVALIGRSNDASTAWRCATSSRNSICAPSASASRRSPSRRRLHPAGPGRTASSLATLPSGGIGGQQRPHHSGRCGGRQLRLMVRGSRYKLLAVPLPHPVGGTNRLASATRWSAHLVAQK